MTEISDNGHAYVPRLNATCIYTTCIMNYYIFRISHFMSTRVRSRAVARTLIGGGGCIFIYSGYARLTSFEIDFSSKETSRAEPEYMNIHPPQLTL